MTLGFLMGAFAGGLLVLPLLRLGARVDRARIAATLTRVAFVALVVAAIAAVPVVFRNYGDTYAKILIGFPLAAALLLIPFVAREKPRDWSQIPHAGAGLLAAVVLGSELFLAMSAAGLFPARFPAAAIYVAGPRAATALAGSMQVSDPVIRKEAVKLMASIHPLPRAKLQAAAADKDQRVRYQALSSLWGHPDPATTPLMLAALNDSSRNIRGTAYLYFGKQPDPRSAPRLLELVAGNPEASELRSIQDAFAPTVAEVMPYLTEQFKSDDVNQRRAVVSALGRADSAETVSFLETALKDRDVSIRALAAETLGVLPDDLLSERNQVADALQSGGTVRTLYTLTERPPDVARVIRALARALRDPAREVRLGAARGLKKATTKRVEKTGAHYLAEQPTGKFAPDTNVAVVPLLACMREADPDLRLTAAEALRNCATPKSYLAIGAALPTADAESRAWLIEALGEGGNPLSAPLVRKYGTPLHTERSCKVCQAFYELEAYDDIVHYVYEDSP